MMLNILEHFPIGDVRPQLRRGAAHADRSEEAGLCRHAAARRRSRASPTCRSRRCCRRRTRAQRAGLIDPRRADADVAPGTLPTHGGDTTYLCVVDAAGNIVSLIQSNFANFGSGVVPEGAGFVLQSRGGLFTFDRVASQRAGAAQAAAADDDSRRS